MDTSRLESNFDKSSKTPFVDAIALLALRVLFITVAAGVGAIDLLLGRLNFLMHKSFFRWDRGLAKFPWGQTFIVQHSGLRVDTLDSIRPRYLK